MYKLSAIWNSGIFRKIFSRFYSNIKCKAYIEHFTYELFVVWFPLVESGDGWTLAAFGTIIYLRPATMAIDCGANRSASLMLFFGVAFAVGSSFEDRLLTGVLDADLFNGDTFFGGRFWAANGSVGFAFTVLSSDCWSLFAVAACAFCAASIFSLLQCYTHQTNDIETIRLEQSEWNRLRASYCDGFYFYFYTSQTNVPMCRAPSLPTHSWWYIDWHRLHCNCGMIPMAKTHWIVHSSLLFQTKCILPIEEIERERVWIVKNRIDWIWMRSELSE